MHNQRLKRFSASKATGIRMDKKVKKKSHVLQQRIQTLRQQLAGAKKQMDDKDELQSLERQLAAAEAELAKLKES
jgi:hypothetical protein